MASKRKKSVKSTQTSYTIEGLKPGRLILGAVIVFVILGSFVLKTNNSKKINQTPMMKTTATITKIPSRAPIKEMMPSPIIKKLPFTKSEQFQYTIKSGDSLGKIGNIFCNDSKAYLHLAQLNNISESVTLQPGDTITVDCN